MDRRVGAIPPTVVKRRGSLILGIVAMALLWAGVGYKYVGDRRDALLDAERTNESYTLVFEESVLRAIGEIDKSLLYMRHTLESANGASLYDTLAGTKDLLSDIIVQVAIIDEHGIMRASNAGPQPPEPIDLSDRPHFKVHVGTSADMLFISKPVIGRASKRLSVQFSRRFNKPDGSFGGVVVASLDPGHLTRLYDGVDFGAHASVSLVGDDNVVRSSGGAGDGFPTGADLSKTQVAERIAADEAGTFEQPAGNERVDELVTLRRVKGHPLWVVATEPTADVYHEADATLRLDSIIAGVISILVALVVYKLSRIEAKRCLAEAEVRRLALQDPLTDLPNRRVFRAELEKVTEATRNAGGAVSCGLLLLDLDRFKLVNDTLGHGVGDALLRMMGRRLASVLGQNQLIARLGGDEFAVVVPRVHGREMLDALAGRLAEVAASTFDIDKHHIGSGVSIGIAIGPRDGANADDILIAADLALYAAKVGSRGSYLYYDRSMSDGLVERRQFEGELRAALEEGRLELYYQPSVSVADGSISSFEALARWHHPTRGSIPPSLFIAIAEESGLIHELGEWALREACRQAMTWPEAIKVAVNLSPVQFAGLDLVATVEGVLRETGLSAKRLELEITEQMLLDSGERTTRILKSLKALGLSIAMDDFGTGYSSLNYLRDFPFDRVKVDRSFVSGLGNGSENAALVRAVIDIARSFGMSTTAEGVETVEQRDIVAALGCRDIQGYFYGRPIPSVEVVDFIARWGTSGLLAA